MRSAWVPWSSHGTTGAGRELRVSPQPTSADTQCSPGLVIPVCRISGKTGIQYSTWPMIENCGQARVYRIPAFRSAPAGMTSFCRGDNPKDTASLQERLRHESQGRDVGRPEQGGHYAYVSRPFPCWNGNGSKHQNEKGTENRPFVLFSEILTQAQADCWAVSTPFSVSRP